MLRIYLYIIVFIFISFLKIVHIKIQKFEI